LNEVAASKRFLRQKKKLLITLDRDVWAAKPTGMPAMPAADNMAPSLNPNYDKTIAAISINPA